eukprot:3372835-Alexandrium_andersonii.AAC.1
MIIPRSERSLVAPLSRGVRQEWRERTEGVAPSVTRFARRGLRTIRRSREEARASSLRTDCEWNVARCGVEATARTSCSMTS